MNDAKIANIDYDELAVRLLCAKMDIVRPKGVTATQILNATDNVYRQEAFRMAQVAFEYIADSVVNHPCIAARPLSSDTGDGAAVEYERGWKDAVEAAANADALAACKGEQYAFEEWARTNRYDMEEHPLHYIFTNSKTDAARMGWKAALQYALKSIRALPSPHARSGK